MHLVYQHQHYQMLSKDDQMEEEKMLDEMRDEIALTTVDNPFDPFSQFDDWRAYDESKGYYTCAYLARIVKSSDDLSDLDQAIAIHQAIDEIIKLNVLGIYKKVINKL